MIKNRTYKVFEHAFLSLAVLTLIFTIAEPAVSFGAQSQFTVTQAVSTEISFATLASNVNMSPTLGGITGGTANGLTQVAVVTNDLAGYFMTIQASSSLGMIGNASSTNYIPVYSTTSPDYNFILPANTARYGYSVNASNTSDVVQLFRNNGSSCNQAGGSPTTGNCWFGATTTAVTIINRSIPTTYSGATTTISFRVGIASNPSPTIPNDNYVATSTLTATGN